jgi:hypothetical protein
MPDDQLLRRWVETWQRAGVELERIRRAELQSVDTKQAVRQLFGASGLQPSAPAPPTSGLIEQQAWFARVRRTSGGR